MLWRRCVKRVLRSYATARFLAHLRLKFARWRRVALQLCFSSFFLLLVLFVSKLYNAFPRSFGGAVKLLFKIKFSPPPFSIHYSVLYNVDAPFLTHYFVLSDADAVFFSVVVLGVFYFLFWFSGVSSERRVAVDCGTRLRLLDARLHALAASRVTTVTHTFQQVRALRVGCLIPSEGFRVQEIPNVQ